MLWHITLTPAGLATHGHIWGACWTVPHKLVHFDICMACKSCSGARDAGRASAQGFFAEVREVDRDNEVNRILGAFKLNPFEQMGLRFDATLDEAKRQYRKASLLVRFETRSSTGFAGRCQRPGPRRDGRGRSAIVLKARKDPAHNISECHRYCQPLHLKARNCPTVP